jgi:hypothetical protein
MGDRPLDDIKTANTQVKGSREGAAGALKGVLKKAD